jgi:hypothetical protein
MSEIETLRRRAEWAESQLRACEVEQAQRKANELAAAQTTQNETESAERKSALEAEIEKTRRGSWVCALLKNADPAAPFDVNKFEEAIPKTGWPTGDGPHNYHFTGEKLFGIDNDDGVGNTLLGKMFAELQERTKRVQRA